MITKHFLTTTILTLLLSCQSQENSSNEKEQSDTSKTAQLGTDTSNQVDLSMFILDTANTVNFGEHTIGQISRTLNLIATFDNTSTNFRRDTFDVDEETREGCEIIAVHDKSTKFMELYGTLFGEMGKTEFRYLLNGETMKLSSAIFTNISYDRPMYQTDMKIALSVKTYEIYSNNRIIAVLNEKKQNLNYAAGQLKAKEKETYDFFKTYIGQIKIVK